MTHFRRYFLVRAPGRRISGSAIVLGCALAGGCGGIDAGASSDEKLGASRELVLSGVDDRRELYELTPETDRQLISGSVAALVWSHHVELAGAGVPAPRMPSLQEALGVCEGERFSNQPSGAYCSGILIDDDLLLSAGHCLGTREQAEARCSRLRVVFDYHLQPDGQSVRASSGDVYSCRRVVQHRRLDAGTNFVDLAIIQLDAPVNAKRAPVEVARALLDTSAELTVAAHGAGLPLKVESNARVTRADPAQDYFVAETDSFSGGSGGALFDASMQLVGYQVRGTPDWTAAGGCLIAATATPSREQHQHALTALRALCETGWPSERLCATTPRCEDGVCSASETPASCPSDCQQAACGDGLCAFSKPEECAADCNGFADVPTTWLEDPFEYESPFALEAASTVESAPGCSITPGKRASWNSLALAVLMLALSAERRRGSKAA